MWILWSSWKNARIMIRMQDLWLPWISVRKCEKCRRHRRSKRPWSGGSAPLSSSIWMIRAWMCSQMPLNAFNKLPQSLQSKTWLWLLRSSPIWWLMPARRRWEIFTRWRSEALSKSSGRRKLPTWFVLFILNCLKGSNLVKMRCKKNVLKYSLRFSRNLDLFCRKTIIWLTRKNWWSKYAINLFLQTEAWPRGLRAASANLPASSTTDSSRSSWASKSRGCWALATTKLKYWPRCSASPKLQDQWARNFSSISASLYHSSAPGRLQADGLTRMQATTWIMRSQRLLWSQSRI